MKTHRQSGVSMIGILIILALFTFFLLIVLRLLPAYFEGRAVRTAIESVAANADPAGTLRDINRAIANNFDTNRIEALDARDVKVTRDKQKIIIDASYEHRVPLFEGVDAVLIFDDIVVTVD